MAMLTSSMLIKSVCTVEVFFATLALVAVACEFHAVNCAGKKSVVY